MIPHRPSLLPADCRCGATVRAGGGHYLPGPGGAWVACPACALRTAPVDAGIEARLAARHGPDGWAVSPYQAAGARFLAARWCALLSDRMGLGKTAQVALALPPGAPVVVVCPAQVKPVWARELGLWRPELAVLVLAGRQGWQAPAPGQVAVVNYDVLPPVPAPCVDCAHPGAAHSKAGGCGDCSCPAFRGRLPSPAEVRGALGLARGTVLVADEAHKAKDLAAARTKRLRYLAQGCVRRWGLTGSPILNHPRELWALYRVLGLAPAAFPGGAREFGALAAFCDDRTQQAAPLRARWVAGRARVELGRTAEEVGLELPELRLEDRLVELTPADAAHVAEALAAALAARRVAAEVAAGTCAPADAAARRLLLVHTSYGEEDVRELVEDALARRTWAEVADELSRLRRALGVAKLRAAQEYAQTCEEAGEPLVVYSAHVAAVDALGARPGWASLRDTRTRQAHIDAFQRGELRGLAGVIRGSAEGITLTRARLLLFVDCEWTPEANTQALKRIHRRGQDRGCLVTTLWCDHPVDRHVAYLLARKAKMIETCTRDRVPGGAA